MTRGKRASQQWKAERYAGHAGFVPAWGEQLLELLSPQPGERILDLGCGDGVLSEKIATSGATVVGVDAAPDMVRAAQQRGIDARLMDSIQLTFQTEFDAAFSNAALHWMKCDPDAVLSGVKRALRPGGRFAAEMGGHGNVAAITVALLAVLKQHGIEDAAAVTPWYFPTTEEYQARLERSGFGVELIQLIPRPTRLPTDMRGWLETFAGVFFQRMPEPFRETALEEVIALVRPALCDQEEHWTVDYVRLRFLARVL